MWVIYTWALLPLLIVGSEVRGAMARRTRLGAQAWVEVSACQPLPEEYCGGWSGEARGGIAPSVNCFTHVGGYGYKHTCADGILAKTNAGCGYTCANAVPELPAIYPLR